MKTFKDAANRTWTIAVNIAAVSRVRKLLDVDLLAPHEGEPPLVARLHGDVVLLVNVIYVLCKPEADALKVTDEQFGEAMGGEAAYLAYEAFMEEWADFFRQLHRGELETVIRRHAAVVKAKAEKDQPAMHRAMDLAEAAVDRERERLLERLARQIEKDGPLKTSTTSPESPASIPSG
jgi:hypothetical protein